MGLRMKILFLSPNYRRRTNWGHQLFRDEVIRQASGSMQYGEGCEHFGKTDLREIFSEVGYHDVVVLENQKNMQKYTHLSDCECMKVIYLGDYLPDGRGNIEKYNELINKHQISIAFCPVPTVLRLFREEQAKGRIREECKAAVLPYSVDTKIYKPRPHLPKVYDVMAVFGLVSYIYPRRPVVQKTIREMPGIRSLIGDWKSRLRWMDYARAISQSRIFVSVNGIHNQITMKYTEAMASGSLLLTNEPEDFRGFGFEPGTHCVTWSSLRDLKEQIVYYLANDEKRKRIADNGRRFVRRFYSTEVMAMKVIKKVKNEADDSSYGIETSFVGGHLN